MILFTFLSLRDLVAPPEMIGSDARQIHMGPHLGPPLQPHANVIPGRAYPGAGEHDCASVPRRSCLKSLKKKKKEPLIVPLSVSASLQDMASCLLSPWKQLHGDKR